ncbi:AAA family ATPase [Bacillus sp. Marseille-Q1617]|uniref:AAA family ATPase n=1 Tax=Bacillus sp. Marseille-Q1617 TaxID=2736887 RepID=UPI00158E4AB9|nr:SMC family ATPase [Bacillus sp. Marseille-Q1617]
MKPLKLTLQAFGPYAEREEIDFRQLDNRTMFVISGKTGSGKTTIFDGISYAIYGKASGEDRTPTEMRSQFAKDEDVTEVELLFSLRGKTYRIWRSPQQDKKKARGNGFTTINARAELFTYEKDGTEKLLAANVRDVDEKIKSLIQLDANQFRQILMIPQGEFRKLLTSDSKDKEVILQRLFHTQLYKVIQEGLKAEADDLRKTVEASVETRTRELLKIYTDENEELKVLLQEEQINDSKIVGILPAHIEKMEQKLAEEQNSYQSVQNRRDNINKQLAEANTLLQLFELQGNLAAELNSLEQKKTEMEGITQEITLAHKAARLMKQDEYCHKLNQIFKDLKHELQQLVKEKEIVSGKLESAKKQYKEEAGKESLRDDLVKKVNHLESIQEDVYSLDSLQSELNELEEKTAKQEQLINKQSEQITFLRNGIKERESRLEKLEDIQHLLFQSEKSLQEKESLVEALKEIQTLSSRLDHFKTKCKQLNEQYSNIGVRVKDASESVAYLDSTWRAAQSAILARDLKDGSPCPVCGSLDHPAPARDEHQLPSEEDMNSAKETLQSLQSEEKQISLALAQEETKIQGTEEQIHLLIKRAVKNADNLSIENYMEVTEEAQLSVEHLKGEILEKKKEAEYLKEMRVQVKKGREKLAELEEASKVHEAKHQELQMSLLKKKTAFEKVKETIPSELNSRKDFDFVLKKTKDSLVKMKGDFEKAQSQFFACENEHSVKDSQINDKKAQVEKADADMKQEREAFLSLLTQEGFPHYRAFHEAKKSDEEIAALEDKVKKYGEDLRSVKDRLSDVSKQLEYKEKPEIHIIEDSLKAVSTELKEINEELNRMISQTQENKNILTRVVEINEDIKELEEAYQTVGHLADIARGQNANRLTFERYVLASFLEDILSVANERLIKMTAGRYNLIRKTDRSKGNIQSGLELLIFDQYTGQERHVKTLSGGESFKASLALALGLADVVQQYAGGVSLETMFIDEGFGTLDPEALDHAIEALMDIQSSGRLVGLISHVPELKERIDARLEVISSQNGSRTEFQFMV